MNLVSKRDNVQVLDLGAGVGRHAIPAAQQLGPNVHVEAVDLLESAIAGLAKNVQAANLNSTITGVVSDVEAYENHNY